MNLHKLSVEFDEQRIDAIFHEVNQCHLPGAAVGIAIAGRPMYRKGFGLAHMELPIVLSPSVRMRIHSTSKHFTCLAYLLLCEDGEAGIDDPIGRYLSELNPVSRSVTVRQLMGNVGGLRNPMNLRWELDDGGRETPVEELMEAYRDIDDVNFAPRSTFNYNNSGFELVALAVERITGQRLEDVLRTRIFEPVGMNDTLLRRFNSDFVPNSATMHRKSAKGEFDRAYMPGAIAGAGGIVSSVDDMLRWLKHMDEPAIGSLATWSLIRTPQILAHGTSTGYGCGLWKGVYRGAEILWHSGGGSGANSQMLKVPGAGLDIVVMLNRSDVASVELTERIMDACLPGLDVVFPPPDRQVPTGLFRSPTSQLFIEIARATSESALNGKDQTIATVNGADFTLAFDAEGVLRPSGGSSWVDCSIELIGEPARPRGLKFYEYGNVKMLESLERVQHADGAAIIGLYECRGISTSAEIVGCGDELTLRFNGRFGMTLCKLQSLAQGIWTSKQINVPSFYKALLCFDKESRSFDYVSFSTHTSPLRFERRHSAKKLHVESCL